MLEFLAEHWQWAVGILVGLFSIWATFYVARRDSAKSNRNKQSIWGGQNNRQTIVGSAETVEQSMVGTSGSVQEVTKGDS